MRVWAALCLILLAGMVAARDLKVGELKVGEQTVPVEVVEAFVLNLADQLRTPWSDERRMVRVRAAVIDELTERMLVAQEVRRRGLSATAEQLDRAEQKAAAIWGTPERQEAFLRQNRFTRDQYREYVLRPSIEGPAFREALAAEVRVSAEEAEAWWREHRGEAEFQLPERVTGAHLLINAQSGLLATQIAFERKLDPNSNAVRLAWQEEKIRRRERAEKLRLEALQPGADFAALVRQHSDDAATREAGGSLGTFARGAHPVELDDAFLALQPGEIGPVVETDFGFHVIKTLARQPAARMTWEEARPAVEQRLRGAKVLEKLKTWLEEARRKN